MGYATTYSLSWIKTTEYKPVYTCDRTLKPGGKLCLACGVESAIHNVDTLDCRIGDYIRGHDEMSYAIEPDGSQNDSCKWYDWKDDMIAMSTNFPGVLFKLHGDGEEAGDIWDAYFLNGKSQVCKAEIAIPPLDMAALTGDTRKSTITVGGTSEGCGGGVGETIIRELLEIMDVYHEQDNSKNGVGTPGGLEHMGDVWRLLLRWEELARGRT